MSRGNRRQDIYLNDVDRQDFLKTLAEACQKTGWQIHAFCLMNNHYHWSWKPPGRGQTGVRPEWPLVKSSEFAVIWA